MQDIINRIKYQVSNDIIIVATSTGVDSMTLLDLCMKSLDHKQIIVAHVNHKVRKESDIEEEFITKYCNDSNISIYKKSLSKLEGNFEEEARYKRYEFFNEVASITKAKYILTAHNANDNLETIIMRLIKSSSLKGYAGIEELSKANGVFIYRPLLTVSKKDIYKYAKDNNLTFFEDITNTYEDHTRNRIRHNIIPLLEEENNELYKSVTYYSKSLLNANSLLEEKKLEFINNKVIIKDDYRKFYINDFLELSSYLQTQVLFRILRMAMPSIEYVKEILAIIQSNKTKAVSFIKDYIIVKEYGYIEVSKNKEKVDFYLEIDKPGEYKLLSGDILNVDINKCYLKTKDSVLWYNINDMPIIVRSRKNGDRITRQLKNKETNELSVYTQKVSDILTNLKIPYLQRINTLVLVQNNEVIAILGLKVK